MWDLLLAVQGHLFSTTLPEWPEWDMAGTRDMPDEAAFECSQIFQAGVCGSPHFCTFVLYRATHPCSFSQPSPTYTPSTRRISLHILYQRFTSRNMFGYLLSAVVAFVLISYFIIWPVADYFRDPKGLRKYPSLNFLCGITDLAFMYEAHKGFRSHALLEAHQKSPVVRIGPNSLSYSDLSAIKVS